MRKHVIAALGVVCVAGPAAWGQAYATRQVAGGNELVTFDVANIGGATIVGNMGVSVPLAGLDHIAGRLFAYGESTTVGAGAGGLYRVDRDTGAATYVGGSDLNGYVVRDLAYSPHDGNLYGLAIIAGNNSNFAHMVTIDPATGLTTSRRDIWGSVNIQLSALAAVGDGTFYAVDTVQDALWRLTLNNLNRFDAVRVGTTLGGNSIAADQGFYIDWAGNGAAILTANGTASFQDVRSVNLASGTSSVMGVMPFGVNRRLLDVTVIPAPSAAALLALGGLAMRRRR